MSVMGWSSTAMAARYQHVTDPIRRDVAERIGDLLWAERKGSTMPIETKIETMPGPLRRPEGLASAFPLVGAAEDAGFEPARACTQPAFQVCKPGSGPVRRFLVPPCGVQVTRPRTPMNVDN
jgi:hypothetical protein